MVIVISIAVAMMVSIARHLLRASCAHTNPRGPHIPHVGTPVDMLGHINASFPPCWYNPEVLSPWAPSRQQEGGPTPYTQP